MFKHFLILQSSGVPLFSFSNGTHGEHPEGVKRPENLDTSVLEKSTLFSGLVSSIISLGKELGGTLKQVKLNNADLYTYEHDYKIIGVSLTDPEEEPEEIEKYKRITETITNHFVEKYEDKILNWKGNTTVFEGFKNEFDKLEHLEQNIEMGPTCTPCIIKSCDMLPKLGR